MKLLLVVTIPVMILAAHGVPDLAVAAATLVGGTISAGAANTLNTAINRVMQRTRNRPLMTGEVRAQQALRFTWLLTLIWTRVLRLLTT